MLVSTASAASAVSTALFVIVIFLKTSIFELLCFLKWCSIFDGSFEHLLLKSTLCSLTSAKLHHWGHSNESFLGVAHIMHQKTYGLWLLSILSFDGSNKLSPYNLACMMTNMPESRIKQTTKQFWIWLQKMIGPIIFWGGERSQRGKEKDGCDHPLTEAISYRHITWLLVGDFLRLKSGDDKKWCQSSPAS